MNRGFTVVEILITLTVMAVLLGLGTVGLRSAIANGRDAERTSDIQTIARGLEGYYDNGNSHVKTLAEDPNGWTTKGSYPGTVEMLHILGTDWCAWPGWNAALTPCSVPGGYAADVLPGVSQPSMSPPGNPRTDFRIAWYLSATDIANAVAAGAYVYVPYDESGNNCTGGQVICLSYELRYKSEVSGATIIVKSKHQ